MKDGTPARQTAECNGEEVWLRMLVLFGMLMCMSLLLLSLRSEQRLLHLSVDVRESR